MAKVILQSVGEDVVAFGDQAYWVAENVKRFLNNFQPGMEVDVTVKEINGAPMVTFLKKSGFAPGGAPQKPYQQPYQAPPQQYQPPAQPYTPPMAPPRPPTPAPAKDFGELADAIYALVAVEIVKGGLDTALIDSIAKTLAGKATQ
jgi:hypothetical protein